MFWKNDKGLKRLEIIFQSGRFYPAKSRSQRGLLLFYPAQRVFIQCSSMSASSSAPTAPVMQARPKSRSRRGCWSTARESTTASRALPSPLWEPKGEGDAFRLPAHVPHPDGPKDGRDPRLAPKVPWARPGLSTAALAKEEARAHPNQTRPNAPGIFVIAGRRRSSLPLVGRGRGGGRSSPRMARERLHRRRSFRRTCGGLHAPTPAWASRGSRPPSAPARGRETPSACLPMSLILMVRRAGGTRAQLHDQPARP
jgi:hypothetical protein